MIKIKVKPLSINSGFQGRRFKNAKHKAYEEEVLWQLPKIETPEGKLEVHYIFGLSNKNADVGNCEKIFTDCLQKKYRFDDRFIYKFIIEKVITKKGEEFVQFAIKKYE